MDSDAAVLTRTDKKLLKMVLHIDPIYLTANTMSLNKRNTYKRAHTRGHIQEFVFPYIYIYTSVDRLE